MYIPIPIRGYKEKKSCHVHSFLLAIFVRLIPNYMGSGFLTHPFLITQANFLVGLVSLLCWEKTSLTNGGKKVLATLTLCFTWNDRQDAVHAASGNYCVCFFPVRNCAQKRRQRLLGG